MYMATDFVEQGAGLIIGCRTPLAALVQFAPNFHTALSLTA